MRLVLADRLSQVFPVKDRWSEKRLSLQRLTLGDRLAACTLPGARLLYPAVRTRPRRASAQGRLPHWRGGVELETRARSVQTVPCLACSGRRHERTWCGIGQRFYRLAN